MSELLVNTIKKSDGSGGIDIPSTSGEIVTTAAGSVEGAFTNQIGGRRNLIINGAMQVAQRGTSFTSLGSGSSFTLDRMKYVEEGTTDSRITVSQDSTSPDDFAYSLKVAVTTADTSLDAGHIQYIRYAFEGQEMQHINKGTASAKAMTLSFYVRSNKTGTYIVQCNHDDSSRFTSQSYTIDTADTWERKTITIPADTSGTITNDSTNGLELQFHLSAGTNKTSGTLQTTWDTNTQANRAVGQTNLMDSTSNTWFITGVQLEVGSVATPFEHRSYGEELAACMRYCYVFGTGTTNNAALGTGFAYQTTWAFASIHFPVEMRATPTLANVGGSWEWSDWHVSGFATGTLSFGDGTRQGGKVFSAGTVSGLTDYRDYFLQRAGGNPTLTFDAEL